MQHDQVGLPVGATGALQRAEVEILAGQRLAAGGIDARQRAQLDGQQASQGGGIDRVLEGQADGVEIGDPLGLVLRRGLHRFGQQGHQRCRAVAGSDGDAAEWCPWLGRAKLEHARTEPAPRARLRRGQGDDALRMILGAGLGRAGVRGEEHRHRVPAAQEVIRHDQDTIGALHLVERWWRVLGVGEAGNQEERYQAEERAEPRARQDKAGPGNSFLPLPLREGVGGRGRAARTSVGTLAPTPPPNPFPQGEGRVSTTPTPSSRRR